MDNKTKKYTIVSTVIFIVFFYSLKYLNENKNKEIKGVWKTKENDGRNYIFDFYINDSLKITDASKKSIFYRVDLKNDSILLFEEGSLSFKWRVEKVSKNHLILTDDESVLNLYK